jgi:zinc transport system permease protein
MIDAILNYNFVQNAFLAAFFASLLCGIIGTVIVEKRLVSMSGGIAHASFGGIGLGYLIGVEPIIPGLGFSIFAALSISKINRSSHARADTLTGMFWAIGMALGIMFISLSSGYKPDMTTYLFGDILTVTDFYLNIMMVSTVVVVFIVVAFFDYWKGYMFDEEYMSVLGMNVVFMEKILFVLISCSIVILIKVVGIILSIALLTIPPSTAKLFTKNLKSMMVLSTVFGLMYNGGGLVISYYLNIPSGATIILFSSFVYFTLMIFRK